MNADPANTLCSPLSPDIMYILSCLTDLYTVLKYRARAAFFYVHFPWTRYNEPMMRRDTMDMEQMIEYIRQEWFENVMQDRAALMEIASNYLDEEIAQMSEDEIIEEYTRITGLDG